MKRARVAIRIAREIGAEFAGVLRRDVERCVEHARLTRGLGPAWSVTEAVDLGKQVLIRFDPTPEIQYWRGFTICVRKATVERPDC